MKNKFTYILISVLTLGICYFVFINVITESYPVVPSEVRDQLIGKLENNNVWFMEEGTESIRFFKSDKNKILSLASSAANMVLPFRRSFLPVQEKFESFVKYLEHKGINYEIKSVSGKKWVVYESSDENLIGDFLLNGI